MEEPHHCEHGKHPERNSVVTSVKQVAAERGNTRDPEMPTTQPGRNYPFRPRVRCNACQHRMRGLWRSSPTKNDPDAINIYYRCPTREPLAQRPGPEHRRELAAEISANQIKAV
jgi:hypothetical protein